MLNPTNNRLSLNDIIEQQLDINIDEYIKKPESVQNQINLFDSLDNQKENNEEEEFLKQKLCMQTYLLSRLEDVMIKKLKEIGSLDLFENIEMPTIEVLSEMQWNGMYANKKRIGKLWRKIKRAIRVKDKNYL